MESKELRVGNLVYSYENKLQTVHGILIENNFQKIFTDKDANLYFHVEGLRPIPLTEEWLKKFGFEFRNSKSPNRYNKVNDKCFFTLTRWRSNCNIFYAMRFAKTEIKYVHQLQNLYFALTNTELTFNQQNQIK